MKARENYSIIALSPRDNIGTYYLLAKLSNSIRRCTLVKHHFKQGPTWKATVCSFYRKMKVKENYSIIFLFP